MDDKQTRAPRQDKSKASSGGKGGLIVIALIVVLVGAVGTLIAFDIFGLREQLIMPHLRNAPLISNLFPEPEELVDDLPFDELFSRYQTAQMQIESLQNQNLVLQNQIVDAQLRIANLLRFEERWNDYRVARAQMDQYIAHGDPINFMEFFAHVSEENVPELYTQAEMLVEFENRISTVVRTMNSMEESTAGEVMTNLLRIEVPLLLNAIERMSPGRVAQIMETMDPDDVTVIIILMAPDEPQFAPLVPTFPPFPPYLPEVPALYALPPVLPANGGEEIPVAVLETPPEEEEAAITDEPAPDAITDGEDEDTED